MIAFILEIVWREPLWLLLIFQPVLLWVYSTIYQSQHLTAYADTALHPWIISHYSQSFRARVLSRKNIFVTAWILLCISAAGPRLALDSPDTKQSEYDLDIMVVLDVSRSMSVADIKPNRTRRAELELHEFLTHVKGQRIGVVLYAARPHLYVPLTRDFSALNYYLQSLEKISLPTHGSQLSTAITLANTELNISTKEKAIVLISDGNISDAEQTISTVTKMAANQKTSIYVLGVGSTDGGPIPLDDGSWLTHNKKPVISVMNEALLKSIAEVSGGRYSRATNDDQDWRYLYDNGMYKRTPKSNDEYTVWHELYPWTLTPAILLLFFVLIPYRLRRGNTNSLTLASSILFMLFILINSNLVYANEIISEKAFSAYKRQDYIESNKHYSETSGYNGRFGEGVTYYRMHEYTKAQQQFSAAILLAKSDRQRANAIFNLGNSYFKLGNYKEASRSFDDVLRYQSSHPAAENNQRISEILAQQVEQILIQQGATRAGSGPRRSRVTGELIISDTVSAIIAEDNENQANIIPNLPEQSQQAWADLLRKGIQYVSIAAQGQSKANVMRRQQDLAQAKLYMLKLEDRPANLWNLQFALEEGFTSIQLKANEIPNITPW